MLGTILLILLVPLLLGALGGSRRWGYFPGGILGTLLLVLLVLVLLGYV